MFWMNVMYAEVLVGWEFYLLGTSFIEVLLNLNVVRLKFHFVEVQFK